MNPEIEKFRLEKVAAYKAWMYRFDLKSLPIDWDYLHDAVYEWVN